MEGNNEIPKRARLGFAATGRYEETAIVSSAVSKSTKDWLQWGDANQYPHYLQTLYDNAPTLHSVIDGFAQYIAGEDVTIAADVRLYVIGAGDCTPQQFARATGLSIATYGGYAWEVQQDRNGAVVALGVMPFFCIRTNEDNSVFWYSEDFGVKYARCNADEYPKFIAGVTAPVSVHYVKAFGYGAYPSPLYAAAVRDCEVERQISTFHLNEITNGFMGSYLINLNNGFCEDEERKEIEKTFNDKFGGAKNAGRIVLSFNEDKEHAATLQALQIADYGEKYETLSKRCERAIFTAFRANPNLFGIPTEGNGFSNEQYAESFALYNRTQIKPMQTLIKDSFAHITGSAMDIVPFSM